MHETFCQGSVRVDLLGGTLDIYPINVVLDNVNTINCATSLMAKVSVSTDKKETITIISKDYNLEKSFDLNKIKTFSYSDKELGPLKFLMLLLKEFEPTRDFEFTLESNAPAALGLEGQALWRVSFLMHSRSIYLLKCHGKRWLRLFSGLRVKF